MNIPEQLPIPVSTEPAARHLTPARQFQGIPGIAITPNNYLWATWYTGGVNEGPDNFVVLACSTDDGVSWTEVVAVVDPPGSVRAYDPTVWVDPDDHLWLFWSQCTSSKDGHIFDGVSGVWGSWTTDWRTTTPTGWSEPIRIANGVMMNKPVILSNGDWAYPTAVWNNHGGGTVHPSLVAEQLSNVVISRDHGVSYERVGGADIPDRAFDEHMVVELQDGRLWMLVRTKYGIGQSYSSDGGKTWTPGEDSGLGGPNSRFHLRRLQSGNLLLVNHIVMPDAPRTRQRLTAFLSTDDGATWSHSLELDSRTSVSYPDGDQGSDGRIYIIHDRERYKAGEILLSAIREEDIVAGELVSPDSYLCRLVSRTGGVRAAS